MVLQHADPLIKKAIEDMFKNAKNVNKRSGHYMMKTENVLDFSVSKSVDKFLKQMNQKSFLCLAEIKSIYKCYILTFIKKKTCKVS